MALRSEKLSVQSPWSCFNISITDACLSIHHWQSFLLILSWLELPTNANSYFDFMAQGCYLHVRINTQTITKDCGYKNDAFANRK